AAGAGCEDPRAGQRRVQRQAHERTGCAARWIVRHAREPYPRDLSQFLSSRGALAVFRAAPRARRLKARSAWFAISVLAASPLNLLAAGLPGREAVPTVIVTPDEDSLPGDVDAASQGTIDKRQSDSRPFL